MTGCRTIGGVLISLSLICGCSQPAPEGLTQGTVAPTPEVTDPADVNVVVDSPGGTQPVTFGVALDRSEVPSGETVLLVVGARMAEPWHIYAAEGPTGVGRPTEFQLELPPGASTNGAWKLPEAETDDTVLGPVSTYHGDVRFSIPIKLAENIQPGPVQIQCQIHFQACTDQQCLPPSSQQLSVPLTIVSK